MPASATSATPLGPAASFREAPSTLNREAADLPPVATATTMTVPDGPSETVTRPSGLRHGRWEAPSWAFWVMLGVVLALALGYGASRLGLLRRKGSL